MKALGDFFLGEWYFSVPMTLMTITAFALVFWRWLLNANANTNLETLLPDVQENLRRKGTKAALALCKEEKGLIPNTLFVDVPDFVASALATGFGWAPGAPITKDQWLMLQHDNVVASGAAGLAELGVTPTSLASVADGWLVQYRRNGRFAELASR